MGFPEGTSALEGFARSEYALVVAAVGRITGDPVGASDAVQDAIVGFLDSPPRHPVDNLAAWLTVVAVNKQRDRRRRTLAEGRALARVGLQAETVVERASLDADMRAALGALPTRQREICVLHYVLDESVATIAGRLDVSSGAVKTHLFRGRRALAARLVAA